MRPSKGDAGVFGAIWRYRRVYKDQRGIERYNDIQGYGLGFRV